MITTVSLVSICYYTELLHYYDYIPYAVHYIPMILFYNCKFVPLNFIPLNHPSPTSLAFGNQQIVLCIYESAIVLLWLFICFVFLVSTYKWTHMVFVFLYLTYFTKYDNL